MAHTQEDENIYLSNQKVKEFAIAIKHSEQCDEYSGAGIKDGKE
jgi:hypothetical protein